MIVLLLIISSIIFFTIVNTKKKRTHVLGQERAEADEKERQRIESGNHMPSPLPHLSYTDWDDEQSLINPIENKLDTQITILCNTFKAYQAYEKQEIRDSLSQDNIYTLLEFIKRNCLFGVRKNKMEYIQNGFTAVTMIQSERCDHRDVLVALSFLDFGIHQMNINETEIYVDAIGNSEGKTRLLLEYFFRLPPLQKSLKTMSGYTATDSPWGICFIETGYNTYNPSKNLVKILLKVSEYLSTDKYAKGSIAIAQQIPTIWLNAENNKKIETLVSRASGTASVSTELRSEFDANADMQMLLIYLSEFNDNKSMELLITQANSVIPETFSRLCFTEGNLLCLIIQRSTLFQAQDFENHESLKRFEAPIKKIISNSEQY